MKKKINIDVVINFDKEYCNNKCQFLMNGLNFGDFKISYCNLFNKKIFWNVEEPFKFNRCKNCLELSGKTKIILSK